MKPKMLKSVMLFILLLGFAITSVSLANGYAGQADQQSAYEALIRESTFLLPVINDAFEKNKERILPANENSAIAFTIATKRYDNTHILIAVQINAADPSLLSNRPDLDIEFQPVVMGNGQWSQKVGDTTTGQFHGFQRGPVGSLNAFSHSLTVPPEANGVRFTGTLRRAEHPVEFNFSVGVDGTACIVYTASRSFNVPLAKN